MNLLNNTLPSKKNIILNIPWGRQQQQQQQQYHHDEDERTSWIWPASLCIVILLALALGLGLGLRGKSSSTSSTSTTSNSPSSYSAVPNLSMYKWIDLTYSFNDNTIYWPTSPSTFELEVLADGETDGGYFYSANTI